MTDQNSPTGLVGKVTALYGRFSSRADLLQSVTALALRLVMARMFLKSGLVKLADFSNAVDLFEYEYFEGIPHGLAVVSAFMGTIGETVLPVLLIIGFATRFASAGLLIMTLVISTLVYPFWSGTGINFWWNDHVWWTVSLLAILAYGPGRLSLDYWLGKRG